MKNRLIGLLMACAFLFVFASMNPHGLGPLGITTAQTPPIPSVIPVEGAVDITTASSSTVLGAPGTTLRNYVYNINCINFVNSATVVVLSSSSTTTASVVKYLSCTPSALGQAPVIVFNPPLRLGLNGALVATVINTAGTGQRVFINATAYTAR